MLLLYPGELYRLLGTSSYFANFSSLWFIDGPKKERSMLFEQEVQIMKFFIYGTGRYMGFFLIFHPIFNI